MMGVIIITSVTIIANNNIIIIIDSGVTIVIDLIDSIPGLRVRHHDEGVHASGVHKGGGV